jgi:hypothetical protein
MRASQRWTLSKRKAKSRGAEGCGKPHIVHRFAPGRHDGGSERMPKWKEIARQREKMGIIEAGGGSVFFLVW